MSTQAWTERADALSAELAEYARRHDEDGTFVRESCEALKADGYYKALVPKELGGLGARYSEICTFIQRLAHACPSTSLAFAMHTHLVATTVFKYRKGQPGEALLRKVADKDLVLVSTGAGDWLESGGKLERVEGGYRLTDKKGFCSGSPIGDVMVTSARYEDPKEGPRVLHFPLPFATDGVTRGSDWDTHGMRGTGSDSTSIAGAFVPEESIAMNRPRGPWHPAFEVISIVAFPIIMSTYVGIAERAVELALESAKRRRQDPDVQYLSGELLTRLFAATAAQHALVANANELDFAPSQDLASRAAQGKTVVAEASIRTVEKALEAGGGGAYFRKNRIEQLMRDVRAAPYHPLQPKRQHRFSGRIALGLEPV